MKKVITHIDCPKEWESENDWDSHRPLLYLACKNTDSKDGLRIEFGCGYGSSELLSNYYKGKHNFLDGRLSGQAFLSFDNNKIWADKFPETIFNETYEYALLNSNNAIFCFVDCAPAELRKDIVNYLTKNTFGVVIVHDTEQGADYVYKLSDILSHNFKYRLDYQPEGKPHTTAVSNSINVCEWVK